MTRRSRPLLAGGIAASFTLGLLFAAGCNKQGADNATSGGSPAGAPGAPGGPGGPGGMARGGPGGPGGMMGGGPGGPGGMMGGGPGGRMGGGPGGMMGDRMGGPGGSGAAVAADASGADIFKQKCQFCHGPEGKGGRGGPALASIAGKSDTDVAKTVHDGRGRMPAFGSKLTDEQIKKVVTHAKGLVSSK